MKPRNKPTGSTKEAYIKICKYFDDDDKKCGIIATLLGVGSLIGDYLTDDFSSPQKILKYPPSVQYALIQMAQMLSLFRRILCNQLGDIPPNIESLIELRYLRSDTASWKSAEDFEERIDFLLKALLDEREKEKRKKEKK